MVIESPDCTEKQTITRWLRMDRLLQSQKIMRVRGTLVLVLLILMFAFNIRAQDDRNDVLDKIRLELIELMEREDYLRLRLNCWTTT